MESSLQGMMHTYQGDLYIDLDHEAPWTLGFMQVSVVCGQWSMVRGVARVAGDCVDDFNWDVEITHGKPSSSGH